MGDADVILRDEPKLFKNLSWQEIDSLPFISCHLAAACKEIGASFQSIHLAVDTLHNRVMHF